PFCKNMRYYLETGFHRTRPPQPLIRKFAHRYILQNGLLYNNVARYNRPPQYRLYLPYTLVPTILSAFHCDKTGKHRSFLETRDFIASKVWWPHMSVNVKHYTDVCEHCQPRKNSDREEFGTQINHQPRDNYETIFCDLIGPMPRTADTEYRYVLILYDYFDKNVAYLPVKENKTEDVIGTLESTILKNLGTL